MGVFVIPFKNNLKYKTAWMAGLSGRSVMPLISPPLISPPPPRVSEKYLTVSEITCDQGGTILKAWTDYKNDARNHHSI